MKQMSCFLNQISARENDQKLYGYKNKLFY